VIGLDIAPSALLILGPGLARHPDPLSAMGLFAPRAVFALAGWIRNTMIALGLAILGLFGAGFWAKRRILRL